MVNDDRVAEDRVAIVVGGAGGIGSVVCRRFAFEGYRVIIADSDVESAESVVTSLPGAGHRACAIDILDSADVGATLDQIEAQGPAAVLVVAAGGPLADLSKRPTIATLSLADWRRTVEFNLTGVFVLLQKFAQLRQANPVEDSRVVVIGSTSAQIPQHVIDISYASAKAGVFGLVRQAAFDLAPIGVTVNSVAAGVVGTPAFMRNTSPEVRAGATAGTLLHRLATPEEVAAGVSYLSSRDAGYVTGTVLDINGGSRFA